MPRIPRTNPIERQMSRFLREPASAHVDEGEAIRAQLDRIALQLEQIQAALRLKGS
jgi:hypothetical protein